MAFDGGNPRFLGGRARRHRPHAGQRRPVLQVRQGRRRQQGLQLLQHEGVSAIRIGRRRLLRAQPYWREDYSYIGPADRYGLSYDYYEGPIYGPTIAY